MAGDVEIIDFTRPDGSRKNLFITNIPGKLADEDVVYQLRETFEPYGLLFRVQVFPTQWKPKPGTEVENTEQQCSGYYAFVTFYSAMEATKAKGALNSVVMRAGEECKIAFAKRKKELQEKCSLYFTKCYELINHYLGFNSWSTTLKTMFEDKESVTDTSRTLYIKYVSLVELRVLDLVTEGVGVWQEALVKSTDPLVRIQATGKCRKLCHMRAIENAFSHLLLVILGNGKVHVEIDTTVPELRTDVVKDDQLVKVTELSDQPMMEQEMNDKEDATTTSVSTNKLSASALDDINLQILQELEDDM
ncbi:RAD52 motif-containing protein 1-like [Mya arenaria]|uniref:RAD52 motif-containing protein 1-like n=1 Tax=Mya arenaria TaxID=6604 RepID=UPI0022E1EE4A|nr:RAD52 motif-containing protein 1-like [Mya arenaria]